MRALIAGLTVVLGITLVATTGACGGGGGGGGPGVPPTPEALFTGTNFYAAIAGDDGPPPEGWAWWGQMTADGAGMVTTGVLHWTHLGALSTGPVIPFPYTVDAAGRSTWAAGTALELEGGFAASGSCACLATVANGAFPGLAFVTRRAGTFSTASLNGTYHLVGFAQGGVVADVAFWGTVAFDGSGGTTCDVSQNASGATFVNPTYAGTYGVAGDGTIDFDFLGSLAARGGVLQGGELIVMSGGVTAGTIPAVIVLIRQSTTASSATLSGTYHAVAITSDFGASPHYVSWAGTVTADGVSSMSVNANGTQNEDGAISTFPALPLARPYSVTADGTLSVLTGAYLGGVAPSGAFAGFAGGTGGGLPALWVLVR